MSTRQQGTVLFTGILFLVATTVVIQLWLLTVSMEALLSGAMKTLALLPQRRPFFFASMLACCDTSSGSIAKLENRSDLKLYGFHLN